MQQDGPLQIGQLLAGKYRVERMLGRGGMGAVYAARHEQLGETFAIKVLLPEVGGSSQAANRFLNEAKAASQIKGEHVARVTDVGQDQGLSYMVLELLDGEDVAAALEKRGRFQVHEAVDICMEALEAVAQAHIRSIVHRDLKPANLFLSRCEDGSTIVKVLDFGISKASNPFALDSQNAALTSTKAMLGSPLYMSPEQLRSAKSVTAQSDLWSMGVILYELMAGRVPFMGESLGELFVAILESPMQPLQAVRPDVPAQLVAAVHRCLERDLSRRVSSVLELANLLAPFGTARSTASLESIRGIYARAHGAQSPVASTSSGGGAVHLAQSGSGAVPAASFLPAAPTGANTNHTWGKTNDPAVDAGLPRRSSTGVLVALTIGAVVLVGGGGGGYALYARQQVAAHRAADARLAIENGAAAGDGIAEALATAAAAASAPSAVPTPTAATRPAPAGGGAGSDGAPAGASGGGGGGGGGGATTAGGGGGGGGTSTHATRHTGGGTATSTSTGTKASGSGTLATKPASTGSIDLLHVDRKAQ